MPRCRYLADPGVLPVRDATRVQGKFCFVESREADKSTKNLNFYRYVVSAGLFCINKVNIKPLILKETVDNFFYNKNFIGSLN